MKTFEEYDLLASRTANFRDDITKMICVTLGLNGEAGEVGEKIKKLFRGDVEFNDEFRKQVALELGDVLWYLNQCAKMINYKLEEIADINIKKLESRLNRGKIKGSGDER